MAIGDIIVGIDVSYSKVSLTIGKVDNFEQIQIIATSYKPCRPYDENGDFNEEELVPALIDVLTEAENKSDLKIESAYVTIPGEISNVVHTQIEKVTKDKNVGITIEDVVGAIIEAGTITVSPAETIIDIIPDKFLLDNGLMYSNPIGKKSNNLKLLAEVVTANTEYIRKMQRVFKKAELEIDGFAPVVLVDRTFYLEPSELKKNILLINTREKTTEIGVFFENSFIYTNTINAGGYSITNDIAYILDVSLEEAEKLKHDYGLALKSYIENDNNILLSTSRSNMLNPTRTVKKSDVVEIIEARTSDTFIKINKDIKDTGLKGYIDKVVLSGDEITNIDKSDVVCRVEMNLESKFASNKLIGTIEPKFHDSYALIKYFASKPYAKTVSSSIGEKTKESLIKIILEKVKDFFYS